MNATAFSLKARLLLPVDRPPLSDAWVTIREGKICEIGGQPAQQRKDLGDVALLPALINAHTHLEFSSLAAPLGTPGIHFDDWIREVIRWRIAGDSADNAAEKRSAAVRQGLAESVRGGSTFLGEITSLPTSVAAESSAALHGFAFWEVLGLALDRAGELLQGANAFLEQVQQGGWPMHAGLSPHAPYTVGTRLLEQLVSLSRERHVPLAMHLAETSEELDLLYSASGRLVELLQELNAWHPAALPPTGARPLDYLKLLANADRALVVHGNYLDATEIDFAAGHHDNLSVIYCPRTHAYFEHPNYPLAKMIDHGVNVALGTDSRGSNPDLNMLRELRFAAQRHPSIARDQLLRLATLNAAQAFGMTSSLGSLAPGKQADMIAVPIRPNATAGPHELLLDAEADVTRVYRAGKLIFAAGPDAVDATGDSS